MAGNGILLTVDDSSGNRALESYVAGVMQEYLALWKIKQRKYGPSNISSMGKPGLVVRMNDKLQRLRNFVLNGVQEDTEGSEEDAWLDIMGYALMGVLVHRGLWPEGDDGGAALLNDIERILTQRFGDAADYVIVEINDLRLEL